MSEETKNVELDLIEDVQEVQLQDDELVEDVEVENEEVIEETAKKVKEADDEEDESDDESDEDEDEDEVDEKKDVKESAAPKTKAGMINAMYKEMSKMNKADLMAAYDKFMEADDEGDMDDEDEDDDEEEVQVETKGKVKESYDFKADLDALVSSDDSLTEGFQEKAATIFEAAVKSKISEEIDRLESEYTQNLEEETATIKSELVEKVDGYLGYVVENWMEENRLAVENGLRTEIAESFMASLKTLFTEHYIDVPDSKIDMVDDLAAQVEELEEQLNSATQDNIRLSESVADHQRAEIIAEASKDLAATEAEKLKSLVEDVDFEDADTFAKKVATLKESYFAKQVNESVEEAEIAINENGEQVELTPLMNAYTAALSRTLKS
jgi:hypothetical protein